MRYFMSEKQSRFYIEDEHVKDKNKIMKPVWFDKVSDAIKHMEFLNKNIEK